MKVTVETPGACGELVQGQIKGINFHITCPVRLFSKVTASFSSLNYLNQKINCFPPKPRAQEAANKTFNLLNNGEKKRAINLDFKSEIPDSKGMASSTADITASCLAVAALLKKPITHDQIAQIASTIEFTEGIMYKGIVCFDHVRGILIEKLGFPPPIKILIVDPEECPGNFSFNQNKTAKILYQVNTELVEEAYILVKEGIRQQNPELIGTGATLSALCNQIISYKPDLFKIVSLSRRMGALGVNVAHEGRVIGILLPPDFSRVARLQDEIKKLWGYNVRFYLTALWERGPIVKITSFDY